jgi:hypothetical protein
MRYRETLELDGLKITIESDDRDTQSGAVSDVRQALGFIRVIKLVGRDVKRPGLFAGTAIDYVRARAVHHHRNYNNHAQAAHLAGLAQDVEDTLDHGKVTAIEAAATLESIAGRIRAPLRDDDFLTKPKAADLLEDVSDLLYELSLDLDLRSKGKTNTVCKGGLEVCG